VRYNACLLKQLSIAALRKQKTENYMSNKTNFSYVISYERKNKCYIYSNVLYIKTFFYCI